MNKSVILGSLFVAAAVVACGGGSAKPDAPKTIDGSASDACGSANAFGSCPDATGGGAQKCTWVTDENDPTADNCSGTYLGHTACEPVGTVALAGACQFNACNDGTTPGSDGTCDDGKPAIGYDNCAAGTYCISGRCETMCNTSGASPTCDANHSCSQYIDVFSISDTAAVAGVCDERCDPNTQRTRDDGTEACRSTHPAQLGSGSAEVYPNFGCYEDDNADPTVSFIDFTCSDTPFGRNIPGTGSACSSGTVTDPAEDDQQCTNDVGCGEILPGTTTQVFFSNGCAPGYVNALFAATGSMTLLCQAYCSPADTDTSQKANGVGNGSSLGKDPQDATAVVGRATCSEVAAGGKATTPGETCVYVWPFVAALGSDGNLALPAALNVDIDTIGICIVNANYDYEINPTLGSASPTKPGLFGPDCSTLTPGFAPTDQTACAACGGSDICVGSGSDVCHEVDVACGSGSAQNANGDDKPGNEADCFAIFHDCYNSVEEGVESGSGSGSATVVKNLSRPVASVAGNLSVRMNDRAPFRRVGGIR